MKWEIFKRKAIGMSGSYIWVDNSGAIQKAAGEISRARLLAIDTEYDSFHFFREKLCLVQARTPERVYLFDPTGTSLKPLSEIFSDPKILKILHAGDNDIRILRDYGFEICSIFDTQRVAAILGSRQLALGSVLSEYLGIDLEKPKKLQRSQWDCRPLTIEQIRYAIEDIEYLIPLYRKLDGQLRSKGLEKEALKTFEEEIASANWNEKTLDPKGYSRIPGSQDMRPTQKRRLASLFRWRFSKAKETNRAVFMVLSDQNLLDLARERIYSVEALSRSGIVSSRKVELYGQEIIEALKVK